MALEAVSVFLLIHLVARCLLMNHAAIEYVNPTARAMERMKSILFRPFDLGKWFAIGFTAWLATLLDGGCSSGGSGGSDSTGDFSIDSVDDLRDMAGSAIDGLRDQMAWLVPVVIVLVVVVTAIMIALLWVSSRGKFMFIDNVVHNRALVKQPWHEMRSRGNSLFWWRLFFHIAVVAILVVIIGVPGYFLLNTYDQFNMQPQWIAGLVGATTAIVLCVITLFYIAMLLQDFVVPIMYKQSISVTAAWGRVIALHGERFSSIIGYALWKMLLSITTGIAIVLIVIVTCCIAGILFAVPYIGTVVLLPVSVFFQALALEFIRQFGPDLDVWESTAPPLPQEPGGLNDPGPAIS